MASTLYFVHRTKATFGGAERMFASLLPYIAQQSAFEVQPRFLKQPAWWPSWLQLLYYNYQACRQKTKNSLYFSNDRLTCLDLYRTAGGSHRAFLRTKGLTINPIHPVMLYLERQALHRSKHIVAISRMVKEDLIRDYGIQADKISVVYNGICDYNYNLCNKTADKKALCHTLGLPDNRVMILFVGSGFARKGVKEMLHHLARLHRPFYALIVGKESRTQRYRKLAKRLGLLDRVLFVGPRKDVERFYAAADILFFPTHYEPFGTVILEAMAHGMLILTTRRCGASEIVRHEPIMQTPDDPMAATYLETMIDDKSMRRMVQHENQRIAQTYTLQKSAEQLLKILQTKVAP